ncbi:hypothetical protein B0A49_05416 [Cryomyces minteri]|uniref:G-patch domain-containing protein n=1 Tax=Cryomyces minteri TaxID=331657 RepID=A0A4U0X1V2_9PEZI|nr:hypothetical protein B0A49_05416 [Cryomyces minteri]
MSYKRSRATFEADLQAQQPPFALYGTPLPPFDSATRDDGSYVPVWKQEVTDERGRKRLHGAFTGGFSAGYFNTVGSKEGWTPSTFVSSRASKQHDGKKAARTQQRPEDFMDEEDLADVAEAQKLQTNDSFAGLGSTEEESARRGMLVDLLKTSGETMGVRLLQKMGWRQGQGVGPKVRRKAREDGLKGEDTSGELATHLFAPENSRMVTFTRKSDQKGLGYAGETRLSSTELAASHGNIKEKEEEASHFPRAPKTSRDKINIDTLRGGFGVGILNDNGSDDEDPYEMGPRLSYNKVVGADKKKSKRLEKIKPAIGTANPLLRGDAKPKFISKKASSSQGFRRCHDGRLPLNGFVLSSEISFVTQDNQYAPPKIPDGWISSKKASSTSSQPPTVYQSTADVAKASSLDPKARAALLGESQLPGKSVFDFLSTSARDRLVSASGKTNLPAARGEAPTSSEADRQRNLWSLIPRLDQEVAAAALARGLGGWMPYAEDEAKRARYRGFLELRAGLRDVLPERATGASKDEWAAELREFAHAAQVFRPMTGMMASRFTTSSSSPKLASDAPESSLPVDKKAAKIEDPAEEAARLGMYGPLTRSELQFYPTRLVCKRFNVKPPAHVQMDPGTGPAGETQSASGPNSRLDVVSKVKMDEMMREAAFNQPGLRSAHAASGAENTVGEERATAVLKEVMVDAEKNEALEGERAGEAVFKAIFGSDDEDDDQS